LEKPSSILRPGKAKARIYGAHIEGNIDRVSAAEALPDVSNMASPRKETIAFMKATLHSNHGLNVAERLLQEGKKLKPFLEIEEMDNMHK
jgi:hypothetical protein